MNRITRNLSQALPIIDDAIRSVPLRLSLSLASSRSRTTPPRRVTDAEAVAMSRHLALHDGLFLGSSSAVNLVASVRLARSWGHNGRGRRIVTILCDSGARHASRFWCVVLLALPPPRPCRLAADAPSHPQERRLPRPRRHPPLDLDRLPLHRAAAARADDGRRARPDARLGARAERGGGALQHLGLCSASISTGCVLFSV